MAEVFSYNILPVLSPETVYQGEGTSHEEALNRFIDNPVMHFGYVNGNYSCADGEQFVVIGPTQEYRNESYAKLLCTTKSTGFVVRSTDDLILAEMREKNAREAVENIAAHALVRVNVSQTRRDPIRNLLVGTVEVESAGLRIQSVEEDETPLVPWADIVGVEEVVHVNGEYVSVIP